MGYGGDTFRLLCFTPPGRFEKSEIFLTMWHSPHSYKISSSSWKVCFPSASCNFIPARLIAGINKEYWSLYLILIKGCERVTLSLRSPILHAQCMFLGSWHIQFVGAGCTHLLMPYGFLYHR